MRLPLNKTFLIFLATLSLSSCRRDDLSVFTEVVDYRELASFHIGTPDPRLLNPDYGQRLHISWNVKSFNESTYVHAKLRFRNLKEIDWTFPIDRLLGMESYVLLNEDYEMTGGLLTYKVDLIQDDAILVEEKHALWTELILFKEKL